MADNEAFPKPEKKKKKQLRERSPEYLRWIKHWECVIPRCTTPHPVDAHHVTTKARLGSDFTALPICHYHHLNWIHGKGEEFTAKAKNIDFDKIVKLFNERFENGERGQRAPTDWRAKWKEKKF